MKKKIFGIFLCMLLTVPALSVLATSNSDPELEITEIDGGFGVKAFIAARNITAETLHWSFTFDGGIIILPLGRVKEGTSPCAAESEASTFVLGIGIVNITVFAEAPDEANDTKSVTGFVFGPFVAFGPKPICII